VVGELDGVLKVKISAPPVDGAANDEVVRLMSKAFGVSKSSVVILAGHTSRTKRIRIDGADPGKLQELAGG